MVKFNRSKQQILMLLVTMMTGFSPVSFALLSLPSFNWDYMFPVTNTDNMIHGLCAIGALEASAVIYRPDGETKNYIPTSYTKVDKFGDQVQLWDDMPYMAEGVQGAGLCEGGIYLRPDKHMVDLNAEISFQGLTEPGRGCLTMCIFLAGDPGEWGGGWENLVSSEDGFTKSEGTFSWTKGKQNLTSYCKEIGSCTNRYEIQPGATRCPEGHDICANECHNAIMDSWKYPHDVISSKVAVKDFLPYPSPCGCSLYGLEKQGTQTLLANFFTQLDRCDDNILSRSVCLRNNQTSHDCSIPYVPGMYEVQSGLHNDGTDSTSRSRGSLLFIGLVILLQSLFFTNYIYVKTLRRRVDETLPSESLLTEEQIVNATNTFNDTMLFFFNPKKLSEERKKAEETRLREKRMIWLVSITQGLFLNQLRKDPTEEKRFIDWRPIPRKKGLLSTTLLLILSSILLSPKLMNEYKELLVPDLCVPDESKSLMQTMDDDLEEEMNLPIAREQAKFYSDLANNLRDDTSLYGTLNYECRDISDNDGINSTLSGKKSVWDELPHSYPKSKYGEFFPGYCAASRSKALKNAMSATCPKKFCVTSFWGNVYGFISGGGNCKTIYVACPKHTADQVEDTQDYQEAQYRRAQEMQDAVDTFVERAEVKAEQIVSDARKIVEKVLTQIEVASVAFTIYKAVSVFFPTPLEMFRPTFPTMIKINLFGAGSTTFTALIVAAWWGIEYFDQFSRNFRAYVNMDFLKSPCFADNDFMKERSDLLYERCAELLQLSNAIALDNVTIQHIAVEVIAFQRECDCKFPYYHTERTAIPYSVAQYGWQAIDICENDCKSNIPEVPTWMNSINGMTLEEMVDKKGVIPPQSFELAIPIPSGNLTFLGNDTLCFDTTYTRSKYMTPPKSGESYWDVWMRTGLLAMFLIRLFIAIFGFWLLRLADPFSGCSGQYFSLPEKYSLSDHNENLKELKENTHSALKFIAFKQVLLYAFVTNLALLNLIIVHSGDREWNTSHDIFYLTIVIGIAIIVPFMVSVLYHKKNLFNDNCCCKILKEKIMFWKRKPSSTALKSILTSTQSSETDSNGALSLFSNDTTKSGNGSPLGSLGLQSPVNGTKSKKSEDKPQMLSSFIPSSDNESYSTTAKLHTKSKNLEAKLGKQPEFNIMSTCGIDSIW